MGRLRDFDRPDGRGGGCCGAPVEPVATSKYVMRHRRGKAQGSIWPCEQALACEALDRQVRRMNEKAELEHWRERALAAEARL